MEKEEQKQLENERIEKERLEKLCIRKEEEHLELLNKKTQKIDAQQKQKSHDETDRITKNNGKSRTNIFMLVIVLGAVLVGFSMFPSDSSVSTPVESTPVESTPVESTPVESTPVESTPADYTNSIGMEFMLIPSGEFNMGSPSDEEDRDDDEGPVHHVTISDEFYLGIYEVTQKQWYDVMGYYLYIFESDDLSVSMVSWDDVQEFIKKLNEKEVTDKYRLPSEAEWEYACRAGTTTKYSFGDSESKLDEYAWYGEYYNDGNAHPVGQKKPNSFGLYDMHGNVYEWVEDLYHDDYDGAPSDGSVWKSGDGSYRVIRGGSWDYGAQYCRSAVRSSLEPEYRNFAIGFRLLRVP